MVLTVNNNCMKKFVLMVIAALSLSACARLFQPSSSGSEDVEIPEWIEERIRQKMKLLSLPSHYTEEILCGHDCIVYFKYGRSTAIYFSENAESSPNMENIKKQKTIPARWRSSGWLDREYKEWVLHQLDNDSIRSKLLSDYWEEYQCTTLDIFNGEPDSSTHLDLRGTDNKNRYWRDVKVNDFCFGYVGVSSARLAEFNRCINATLLEVNVQ